MSAAERVREATAALRAATRYNQRRAAWGLVGAIGIEANQERQRIDRIIADGWNALGEKGTDGETFDKWKERWLKWCSELKELDEALDDAGRAMRDAERLIEAERPPPAESS